MAQATADMARLLPVVMRSFPLPEGFSASMFEKARIAPNLRPLKQDVVGDVGNVLWVLMGSIVLVLLVACANVANLLLVRVEGRRQELAIRSALGAGWGRIASELLFESLVLGVAGSLIGLALAWGALRILVALAPTGLPRIDEIGINLPGTALCPGPRAFHQPADRLHPGFEIRGRKRQQRSARRRPGPEPEPRAASRAQGAGGGAGSAGAGAAHLLRPHDPHLPRLDACRSRLRRPWIAADIPLLYPRDAGTRHERDAWSTWTRTF